MRQVRRIQKSSQWRFAEAVFAGMRVFLIVLTYPGVQIQLELLQGIVQLFAKSHAVELFLNRAVETFADPIGLRWQLHRNEVFRNEPSRSLIPFTRGIGGSLN